MRILIISDTHGKVDTMLEVLKKEPHDIAIHAGDYDNIEV
jgi:predicted phosphodiesterase